MGKFVNLSFMVTLSSRKFPSYNTLNSMDSGYKRKNIYDRTKLTKNQFRRLSRL